MSSEGYTSSGSDTEQQADVSAKKGSGKSGVQYRGLLDWLKKAKLEDTVVEKIAKTLHDNGFDAVMLKEGK